MRWHSKWKRRRKKLNSYFLEIEETKDLTKAIELAMCIIFANVNYIETDVPWENMDEWPELVRNSALRLRQLAKKVHGDENYEYGLEISVTSLEIWLDCILVAPFVYEFTAYDNYSKSIIEIGDEGRSVVLTTSNEIKESLNSKILEAGIGVKIKTV